jgi:phage major head subunit gpT-like protein
MRVGSGTKSLTYAWLGMSTRFREWLGDRIIQNLKDHGFTITNKRFESTVGVSRDDIGDDQFGVYAPLMEQLGYDAKVHPDELLFTLAKNAHAVKCYDGQNFLDTDHPVEDENGVVQSVSNFAAGAGKLWYLADLSKPIRPFIVQVREAYRFTAMDKDTDQNVFNRNEFLYGSTGRLNVGLGLWQLAFGSTDVLGVAQYAAARAAMFNMTADKGKKLNVTPTHLLVPPTLEGPANALVKAQKDAAGADNIWFGTAQVIVVPWLE